MSKINNENGASDYELVAKVIGAVMFIWAALQIYSCMGDMLQSRRDKNKLETTETEEAVEYETE